MQLPEAVVYDHHKHQQFLPSFARIHAACIDTGAVIKFAPPLSFEKIENFWRERLHAAASGKEYIILQLKHLHGTIHSDELTHFNSVLVGFACLQKGPAAETGPFRGEVQKLLVDPEYRRLGVATRLMVKLEEVAIQHGKTLLLLDTTAGSPAEQMYERLGWTRIGMAKNYSVHPQTRELRDEVFFYKDLGTAALWQKIKNASSGSPHGSPNSSPTLRPLRSGSFSTANKPANVLGGT